MGHVKAPKGVDFIIKSTPLTDEERKEISKFIKKRKAEIQNTSGNQDSASSDQKSDKQSEQ